MLVLTLNESKRMAIHVADKGKEGERELVRILAAVIERVIADNAYDPDTVATLRAAPQRNQNQSAEGGGDINLLGISFEVKRQEQLSVNTWWRQCCVSAQRNKDVPVLVYRQNRREWHVVMMAHLYVSPTMQLPTRVTTDMHALEVWFYQWVKERVRLGEMPRV